MNPSNANVGDIPLNIAVAQQAVNAAWYRNSDPTYGGFTFLVSNNPNTISGNIDIRAAALEDMARYQPQGCAAWWMGLFPAVSDSNPTADPLIAQRVENNGVVLLYSNFVAPTTISLTLPFRGCTTYCTDPNDASSCRL